jgi:hypothetical protein
MSETPSSPTLLSHGYASRTKDHIKEGKLRSKPGQSRSFSKVPITKDSKEDTVTENPSHSGLQDFATASKATENLDASS